MPEIDPLTADDDLPPSKSELKRQMAIWRLSSDLLGGKSSSAVKGSISGMRPFYWMV